MSHTASMDTDALTAVPVCNCHRRRNSLPGPGKFNTVHYSAPGHVGTDSSAPAAPALNDATTSPTTTSAAATSSVAQEPSMPQDIPEQYIVDQLHRLGPFYWHKPETTDCTIQVPIDQRRLSRSPNFDGPSGLNTGVLNSKLLDIRRGSAPVTSSNNPTPKTYTTLKLHQFYLTAQSSLLRTLFSGSSVIGLVAPQTPSVPSTSTAQYALGSSGRRDSMPSLARIPRLLPSSAEHPALYLPLPDPSSFPHIVHYLYFGSPAFIEEALSLGRIRWDGVVRNVEYLGIFEEEGGKGIRSWLAMWRERQRRASYAGAAGSHYHAQAHAQARAYAYAQAHAQPHGYAHHAQAYSGTAVDPILIEESSDGSDVASGEHVDTEMADSDLDEEDDYMYDDEEDDQDEEWSSGEDWDSMAHAIAGMKMADPFSLNPGYARSQAAHAVPMRMESVDPLQG